MHDKKTIHNYECILYVRMYVDFEPVLQTQRQLNWKNSEKGTSGAGRQAIN